MSTVSTRPDNAADSPAGSEFEGLAHKADDSSLLSRRAWLAAAISILIVGAVLRAHHLELVPLHHDEGINGFFLARLFRSFSYQYNPENYHGPSLYYFGLVSAYLLGLNTLAIRVTTAVFGTGLIWMILIFRRQIGRVGSLVGASLVAVSPGAVYLSRYFIHETLFVFFTLGVVIWLLRYRKEKKLTDLVLASSSASLLVATKETSVITAAVLVIAAILATVYVRMRKGLDSATSSLGTEETAGLNRAASRKVGVKPGETGKTLFSSWDFRAVDWGSAAAVAVLLFLLFYSSFLVNPGGILDAFRAFRIWARTGEQQHAHVWSTYLMWLWQEETPLVLLSAAGALTIIWAAKSRLAVFVSLWAIGLLAAYSLIPYKTPWLMLNFIIPMAIVVGCAAEAVFTRMKSWKKAVTAVLLGVAVSASAARCIRLNFYHYDDDKDAYVYAHTQREFLGLVNDIVEAAARAGTGTATEIAVTSPEYWPLPWYLRNYPSVGYHGKVVNSGASIVIGSEAQQQELEELLGGQYVRLGHYSLRPGVVLILYVRRDSAAG